MQTEIRAKGEEIFKAMERQSSASIFNKDWWYGQIMDWSMKNAHFKTQMFRFVDVLPYLKSSSEIARHLKEYFAESSGELPSIFNVGLGIGSFAPALVAAPIKKNVTQMAKMFIAGETPEEAISTLKKSRKSGLTFTADLLGEAALSEKEALEYQARYLELIQWLAKDANSWDEVPLLDRDHTGPIPRVNVSVKMSALYSQINVKAWEESKKILKDRLRPLLKCAKDNNVFLNLDMEQYSLKDLTLEVFRELICEPEFSHSPHWGIVIQAYLKDSLADTRKLVDFARNRGVPFTVRLVKGAYWDYETVLAAQRGWPVPVYTNKAETDANYEECATLLIENHKLIRVALGSHNVRSISSALITAKKAGLPQEGIEIQMLYGMAEPIKKALSSMNLRVREYMPIGELIPGMAYLVRRLLENTSNESFLRSKFVENASQERLLEDPRRLAGANTTAANKTWDFENEPLVDFGYSEARQKITAAVQARRSQTPPPAPLIIGSREDLTGRLMESRNPSHPKEVLGSFAVAGIQEAEQALKTARQTWLEWRKSSVETRCRILDKAADLMASRKYELSALQVLEVGKTWVEADGDVAEAIDFCRYYAKEMRRLSKPQKVGHAPGEQSLYHYQSRGVSLVISPWNFPLAIICGQTVASLVTGNTVIMKPAEQSTLVAYELMKILREAGTPPGVVNFLPGIGEEIGEFLIGQEGVEIISFTGSRQVGLHILKKAGEHKPGQINTKKCIIEMGGKNAIIIDSDADLDEAVTGVAYSAFGFAGQKCSACSRVIVLEENYDRFVDRLHETVKSLKVSFAEDPNAYMGPVIDQEAQQRILRTIEEAKKTSRLLYQGTAPAEGYFVPPTLFADVDPKSSLAQEEIFGPVLAIIKARDMDEALQIANGTSYALTGGLYSRSPANIEKIRWDFEVGNLYINRQITGAMVDRHPFGGFKMSGVGSKTGGPDYLTQFMEPRCVTENTVRRGFAADE